jgi:hypothetical protein
MPVTEHPSIEVFKQVYETFTTVTCSCDSGAYLLD